MAWRHGSFFQMVGEAKNKMGGTRRTQHHSVEQKLLQGRVDHNLPPLESTLVRVFISSTFSDFVCERNELMETTYPKLKTFCKVLGLEFQALDMRWGVPEEAQNDHMTSELCMREVMKCRRLSIGPSCIVLFGQKYGYRPFPATIEVEEFERVRQAAIDKGCDSKSIALLDKWFLKDKNNLPPMYVLQPITSKIPHYANKTDLAKRSAAQAEWWEIFQTLQQLLREGASYANLDPMTLHKYAMSVTEDEARHALIDKTPRGGLSSSSSCHQPILFREITQLGSHINHKYGKKYIDLLQNDEEGSASIDTEAQEHLRKMKRLLEKTVDKSVTAYFQIDWKDNKGVNKIDHKEYLKSFCDQFYRVMCKSIEYYNEKRNNPIKGDLLKELHVHSFMCLQRSNNFMGRADLLACFRAYLNGGSKKVLAVEGASGSGKTALLAQTSKEIPTWFNTRSSMKEKPVVIIRLLGLTPSSSSIEPLLKSMCEQIQMNYGPGESADSLPNEYNELCELFLKLLKKATVQKPLVIVLDSLDQLSPSYGATRLTWLPKILPDNCHIIVSVISDTPRICKRLREVIVDRSNFIYVEPMDIERGKLLLLSWLKNRQRQLSDSQMKIIDVALRACSLPLYTRLVFEEVRKWTSYMPLNQCILEPTVKGMISAFFENLEIQHGKILIQHALGYLTASRAGLSESEIEDVLSLDDDVLNDVFSFWLPPVRRLPSLLWTRIQDSLHSYLAEREADGCKVLCWYHKEFKDAAKAHFLGDPKTCIKRHKMLADYFLGIWGDGKKKPYKHNSQQLNRISINEKSGSADRKVPAQPLKYKCTKSGKIRYNVRKLRELPYHLYMSDQREKFSKEILCNYQWLHTKLYATSLTDVLEDFSLASKEGWCRQIKVIRSVLVLAGSALGKIPNTLAVELVGRLKSVDDTETIIGQCMEQGVKDCLLLPAFQCFEAPVEPTYALFEGHKKDVISITFSKNYDRMYSLSMDGNIKVWEVSNSDLVNELSLPNDALTSLTNLAELHVVTSDSGKSLILVDLNCEVNPLMIFDLERGKFLCRINGTFCGEGGHRLIKTSQYIIKDGIVFDVDSGAKIANLDAFSGINKQTDVLLTHNEDYMLCAFDESLTSISIGSNKVVGRLSCDSAATKLALTRDDKILVAGFSEHGEVLVYDLIDGYQLNMRSSFNYVQEFGQGQYIKKNFGKKICKLVVSRDGDNALVDLNKTFLFSLNLLDQAIHTKYALPIPRDSAVTTRISDSNFAGSREVVALVNDMFCIWTIGNSTMIKSIPPNTHKLSSDSFIISCKRPICTLAKHDYNIKLWDVDQLLCSDEPQVYRFRGSVDYVKVAPGSSLAFIKTKSADYGRRTSIASTMPSEKTHFGLDIRDLSTNKHQTFLPYGLYGELVDMDISFGAKMMVVLTRQGNKTTAFIINLRTEQLVDTIFDHNNVFISVKISLDGKYLLIEARPKGMSGEVQIWQIPGNEQRISAVLLHLIHDGHGAIFTQNSSHVLCIGGKKRIGAYALQDHHLQWSKTQLTSVHSIQAIPNRHDCFLITGSDSHRLSMHLHLNRKTTSIIWNLPENKDVISIDGVSHDGIVNFSKDGCRAVDSRLQVFDLHNGVKFTSIKSKTQCSHMSTSHVLLTYDGQYVIWADTQPTYCIKVAKVDTGIVIAEAGTHAEVKSLVSSDYGYTVTCGCVDGNMFIFKLHRETQLQDSTNATRKQTCENNNSNALEKTFSWPPLTPETINTFDKIYRYVSCVDVLNSASSSRSGLPTAGMDVQKKLSENFCRKSTGTLSRGTLMRPAISLPNLKEKYATLPR